MPHWLRVGRGNTALTLRSLAKTALYHPTCVYVAPQAAIKVSGAEFEREERSAALDLQSDQELTSGWAWRGLTCTQGDKSFEPARCQAVAALMFLSADIRLVSLHYFLQPRCRLESFLKPQGRVPE